MRSMVTVFFQSGNLSWSVVKALLNEAGVPARSIPGASPLGFYQVQLAEGSAELERLRQVLADAGLVWTERLEHVYTARELRAAPLLWLWARTPEKGLGGPAYGTQYDLTAACSRCGTGAVQTSPLVVDPKEVAARWSVSQTLDHELLVAPAVADLLQAAGIRGCSLRRVESTDPTRSVSWVQIVPEVELPPFSSGSSGVLRENPCPVCGRDGYFHDANRPLELVYDSGQVVLESLPDVVQTYERFGNSRLVVPMAQSRFAHPLLLVKPAVFDLFTRHKIRGVAFVPIRLQVSADASG